MPTEEEKRKRRTRRGLRAKERRETRGAGFEDAVRFGAGRAIDRVIQIGSLGAADKTNFAQQFRRQPQPTQTSGGPAPAAQPASSEFPFQEQDEAPPFVSQAAPQRVGSIRDRLRENRTLTNADIADSQQNGADSQQNGGGTFNVLGGRSAEMQKAVDARVANINKQIETIRGLRGGPRVERRATRFGARSPQLESDPNDPFSIAGRNLENQRRAINAEFNLDHARATRAGRGRTRGRAIEAAFGSRDAALERLDRGLLARDKLASNERIAGERNAAGLEAAAARGGQGSLRDQIALARLDLDQQRNQATDDREAVKLGQQAREQNIRLAETIFKDQPEQLQQFFSFLGPAANSNDPAVQQRVQSVMRLAQAAQSTVDQRGGFFERLARNIGEFFFGGEVRITPENIGPVVQAIVNGDENVPELGLEGLRPNQNTRRLADFAQSTLTDFGLNRRR